jgi:hypothetical protein
MKETLLILKKMIEERQLLSEQILFAYNWDDLLDARESDEDFEEQWLRANAEVKKLLAELNLGNEVQQIVEDIRRESFLAASKLTSQHEIASYISDDFGLIAEAILAEYDDAWLNGLWLAYKQHYLPIPPVGKHSGKLSDLIESEI